MKDVPDRGSAHDLLIQYRLDQTFWGQKLIAAEQIGEFDAQDYEDANDWVTCACGKSSSCIEHTGPYGQPADRILYRLGMRFTQLINVDDDDDEKLPVMDRIFKAAETLIDIENRASDLARQHAHGLS